MSFRELAGSQLPGQQWSMWKPLSILPIELGILLQLVPVVHRCGQVWTSNQFHSIELVVLCPYLETGRFFFGSGEKGSDVEDLEAEGSSVSSSSGTGVGVAGGFEGPACASVRRVDRRGCCNGSRDAGLLGGAISAAL